MNPLDLEERVQQYNEMFGGSSTSYLIHDLWSEVVRLRKVVEKLEDTDDPEIARLQDRKKA